MILKTYFLEVFLKALPKQKSKWLRMDTYFHGFTKLISPSLFVE